MTDETPEAVEQGSDATPEDDLLDDQADCAEDVVNDLLKAMDVEGEAVADIDGDMIYVDISGTDMGLLIGRGGVTLDALQELVRAAVQQKTSAHTRLIVDIEGYRDRQQDRLEREALDLADEAKRDKRSIALDPMTSFDRRVVHQALRDVEGILTRSEGEGRDRHIVIVPT